MVRRAERSSDRGLCVPPLFQTGLFIFLFKRHAQESWLLPLLWQGKQGVQLQEGGLWKWTPLGCQKTQGWEAGSGEGWENGAGFGISRDLYVILTAWHVMPTPAHVRPWCFMCYGGSAWFPQTLEKVSEVSLGLCGLPSQGHWANSRTLGSTPDLASAPSGQRGRCGEKMLRSALVSPQAHFLTLECHRIYVKT